VKSLWTAGGRGRLEHLFYLEVITILLIIFYCWPTEFSDFHSNTVVMSNRGPLLFISVKSAHVSIALCALTDSTITVKGEHNQDVCNVQGRWGIIPSANAPTGKL
jgi:hypothetical protein